LMSLLLSTNCAEYFS